MPIMGPRNRPAPASALMRQQGPLSIRAAERWRCHCGEPRIAILPGWAVRRKLANDEMQAPGHGVVWCRRCGSKYEVAPIPALDAA